MKIQTLVVTSDAGERARLMQLFEPIAGDRAAIVPRFAATLDEAAGGSLPLPDLLLLAPALVTRAHDRMTLSKSAGFERVPLIVLGDAIGSAGTRHVLTTGLADDVMLSTDSRDDTFDRLIGVVETVRAHAQDKLGGDIVLAAMADAVIITDAAGRIRRHNDAACRLTLRFPGEMLGMPIAEAMALHNADTLEAVEHPVMRVLGEERTIRLPPKTVMVRADGSEIMIDDSTAPIIGSDGVVEGAVMVFHDISASYELQAQVDYLARHDFLTGLPNRFAAQLHLADILRQASEHGWSLAVMYLDLDNFKWINDTLGHAAGDRLLAAVATRLRACCRTIDLVSRQGGDEFLILMTPGTSCTDTIGAARRVLEAVARPYEIDGEPMLVGCSVGVALYPEHGVIGDTLLQRADTALHAAKAAGRNTFRIFKDTMLDTVVARRTLENALRFALDTDGLKLFYQPKVCLADGNILGCEALLRWQHPDWSRFSPAEMVRCAEQSGLIVALGRWVLREAMRQARAWQDRGLRCVPIAINISALELRQVDFVEHVELCLADHGIAPSIVQIELTESSLMRDVAGAIDVLHRLKGMGMSLAIDDFGTGYSNLAYLADIPVDVLKVDRSFVHGIAGAASRRQALLRAVLSIASNLGLPTVAEGIETVAEAGYLMDAGCQFGQGYLYSPAVSAAAFEHLLAH